MRITASQVVMTATHETRVSVGSERSRPARDVEAPNRSHRRDEVRGHRHRDDDHHHHHHHRDGERGVGAAGSEGDGSVFERLAMELMTILRDASQGVGQGRPQRGDATEGDRAARDRRGSPRSENAGLVPASSQGRQELELTTFTAEGSVTTADGRTVDFSVAFAKFRATLSGLGALPPVGGPQPGAPPARPAAPDPALPRPQAAAAVALATAEAGGATPATPTPAPSSRLYLDGRYLALADAAGAPNRANTSEPGSLAHAAGMGAASVDAFRDLARLDSDHNGSIDEADPAWAHLRLVEAATGSAADSSATLADAGVGAIAVSSRATPFAGAGGGSSGLAASGLYLRESGEVGLVEERNLTA